MSSTASGASNPWGLAEGVCDRAATLLKRELTRLQTKYAEPAQPAPRASPNAASPGQAPLFAGAGAVHPGASARCTLRVFNPTSEPCDVSLYATDFISESGYEIPSLLMAVTPRRITLAPNAQAAFEIAIAVPAQALRGAYSGLVRAMGCSPFNAVVTFEVR